MERGLLAFRYVWFYVAPPPIENKAHSQITGRTHFLKRLSRSLNDQHRNVFDFIIFFILTQLLCVCVALLFVVNYTIN